MLIHPARQKTCTEFAKCLFVSISQTYPLQPQLFESFLILRRVLCENTTLVKLYMPLCLETRLEQREHVLVTDWHQHDTGLREIQTFNHLLSDEMLRTAQTSCMLGRGQNFLSEEPLPAVIADTHLAI